MDPRPRAVVWTPLARELLDEAVGAPPTVALVDEAERIASSLATMSDRGRQVRRLAALGLREVFVRSYRLVYRVRPDVEVVAFVHAASDFEDPPRGR